MEWQLSIPAPELYWLREDFRLYAPSYPIWKLLKPYDIEQNHTSFVQWPHLQRCPWKKSNTWFAMETGLKQGCMLTPSWLFLIALDWKTKQVPNVTGKDGSWRMYYRAWIMATTSAWLLSSSGAHLSEGTTKLIKQQPTQVRVNDQQQKDQNGWTARETVK